MTLIQKANISDIDLKQIQEDIEDLENVTSIPQIIDKVREVRDQISRAKESLAILIATD